MKKALAVTVLLLAVFALIGNKAAYASAATFTSPVIVAKGKLTHQTAPIAVTTIFTPTQDGLYRLSIYATLTTSDPNSASAWFVNIFWTDDAGSQSLGNFLYAAGGSAPGEFGQLLNAIGSPVPNGGPVIVVEAKSGQPVSYSVTQAGSLDNSSYSLYYTIERLE